MNQGPVLGIDIGGTKLAAGVVGLAGDVLSYLRAPTAGDRTADELLAVVVHLAQRAIAASGATPGAVGIGCGGPMIFPDGIVSPLHIPAWRDFPLRARLAEALGLPAVLDNDAKAFALGEALFGAGRGARCLLGMVVSTGVGGGLVVNGRLHHGASGNAGHVGHLIVSAQGPRCYCGAIGCLTVYASGVGLAARAQAALRRGTRASLAEHPRDAGTAEAIATAARAGDTLAARLMREAGQALARGIASAAALVDLDRVVLGGGIAQTGDLLFAPLRAELRRRACLAFTRDLDVRPAALGREAGVVGAAALALRGAPDNNNSAPGTSSSGD
ncbi:MAG: ROK family protein [Thermomicrobiales bacterium]